MRARRSALAAGGAGLAVAAVVAVVAVVVALLAAAPVASAPAALAQPALPPGHPPTGPAPAGPGPGTGAITGIVRNGSTDRPVPTARLTLLVIGAEGPQAAGEGTADAAGRFAFRSLVDGRYLVQVSHQGVTYAAHAVVSSGTTVDVTAQVFDASDKVPLVAGLLGLAVDVRPGYVRVTEVLHLQNGAKQTFLGAVRFALPAAARYLTYHEGLHQPSVEGDQIADRLIVRPGTHQVAYSYAVAGTGEVRLDRRLFLPVARVETFVSVPAQVRTARLDRLPNATNEGREYTRATGRGFPPGDFALSVIGVPSAGLWQAPAAAATLAGLLAVGLIAGLARDARSQPR